MATTDSNIDGSQIQKAQDAEIVQLTGGGATPSDFGPDRGQAATEIAARRLPARCRSSSS